MNKKKQFAMCRVWTCIFFIVISSMCLLFIILLERKMKKKLLKIEMLGYNFSSWRELNIENNVLLFISLLLYQFPAQGLYWNDIGVCILLISLLEEKWEK